MTDAKLTIAAAGLTRIADAFNSLRDGFAEFHARYIDAKAREEIEHHDDARFHRVNRGRPRRDSRSTGDL